MLLILICTFISIAFIVMAVYWLMFRPVSAAAQRLQELDDSPQRTITSIEANSAESLAQRIAEPINRLVPPSAANAKKLHLDLMQAGFRSQSAPGVFRATQLVTMLAFPASIGLVWTILARPMDEAL